MLITPAFAQAGAGGDTNSMLMSLLPFALIFVIMYFLILRPQQKKVKDHAELVKVRVRQMRQMISGVRAKGEPAKERAEIAKDDSSAS
jgi:preprotein translocase subunit YajC